MSGLRFVWDAGKATANQRKHGVTFDEARTAFSDEHALLLDDPKHSTPTEDRFILLGLSGALRLLVVVHAYRDPAAVIRLISARRATRTERATYSARLG